MSSIIQALAIAAVAAVSRIRENRRAAHEEAQEERAAIDWIKMQTMKNLEEMNANGTWVRKRVGKNAETMVWVPHRKEGE